MIRDELDEDFEVVFATIGQFTGLKDKNGTEIYEGDIVSLYQGEIKVKGVAIIKFSYGYVGGWVVIESDKDVNKFGLSLGLHNNITEVVGNIHDKPELLKITKN